jgi:hypothetical protein
MELLRFPTTLIAFLARPIRLVALVLLANASTSAAADLDEAIRHLVEADTLVDARVTAPGGWRIGHGPVACPPPLGVWPLRHDYRANPDLRAEIFVLSLPWLSPADVRAIRDRSWQRQEGAVLVPGSHAGVEAPDAYESDR